LTRGDEIDEDPDNQHVESSPITDDRMGSGGYAGRILMSKQQLKHKTRNGSPAFDRRTMLRYTVGGSVALAATTIGGLRGEAALAPGQTPSGAPVPAKTVRRVVTGHNREGKSYIVSDELVPASGIWTTTGEQPLGAPASGEKVQVARVTGDTRHFVATIQPSKAPKPDLTNRIGFHRTPGIAYCFLLNGQIVFLTDTQEVTVKAGDVVVERNTLHSWRNDTNEPVSMLITTVTSVA